MDDLDSGRWDPARDALWVQLDRFLAGESNGEDARAVRAWLAADPKHREWFEVARFVRAAAGFRPPTWSVERAWRQAVVALGLRRDARLSRPRLSRGPVRSDSRPEAPSDPLP